ncbi:hypothetical protein IFU23_00060 [Pantoea agglomerans]|uniref:hypothetical protein n=1 Tax=Pantoea TaxID=53335 RepID=UPI0005E7E747|nr:MULTISPECIES: hypothetical protein [Pantoea]KJH60458.1 hypothetical protein UF13_14295 [Pantoea agglomerans]MBD8156501.1 hypothetical protein [Pantoea agglomerans]MBD8231317.1 hypothetical protein [Pantoea agglomerans]NEG82269.1 hypothetical protein [Pantoea agglomerans]
MEKMILEESGALLVDGSKIELSSYEKFINSSFFKSSDDLISVGGYYFSAKNVIWHNEPFHVQFRPAIFYINKSVFLISKTGDFYKNISNWEKRANIKVLMDEEKRLYEWVMEKYPNNYKGELKDPPYGHVWSFEWGEITVQSEERSFNCGIYIEWD